MIPENKAQTHTQKKGKLSLKGKLTIQYQTIQILLYQNFNTAHSSSATRKNFFIRIKLQQENSDIIYGYGECGLPPKKPGIYLSDLNDCYQFMRTIQEQMVSATTISSNLSHEKVLSQYINSLKEIYKLCQDQQLFNNLISILSRSEQTQIVLLLSKLKNHDEENFRAPKSALEFSILDYLANKYKQDFFTLLYGITSNSETNNCLYPSPVAQTYSFYSISLTNNADMLNNIIKHLKYSRFIKIKYDTNIQQLIHLLRLIVEYENQHLKSKFNQVFYQEIKFIIDANCSWSPQIYRKFEGEIVGSNDDIMKSILNKLLYIQQPFDFDISQYEDWKQIKASTHFKILADQSFRNSLDLTKVCQVSHAVNIKCQKAGGFFNTLKSALEALSFSNPPLEVIFGTMVQTQLGCSQTYMLAPFAQYFDADGSLLIVNPEINGGFAWNQQTQDLTAKQQIIGKLIRTQKSYGLGISHEQCNALFQIDD